MTSSRSRIRQRQCRSAELGVDGNGNGRTWPAGDVLLASVTGPDATAYSRSRPLRPLSAGEGLTSFLARVAPFGCPVPGSLIRAYSLPDAPFPSILLKEHDAAPDGIGEAYNRFLSHARRPWLAALAETGPGLCPDCWRGNRRRSGGFSLGRTGRGAGRGGRGLARRAPTVISASACSCWPIPISRPRGRP